VFTVTYWANFGDLCADRALHVHRGSRRDRDRGGALQAQAERRKGSVGSLVRTRRELALENLALRQQLAILRRARPKRLRLKSADRIFWAWLSSVWAHWSDALVIVRPDTVVRWHRAASTSSGVGNRAGRAQVARRHPKASKT
jgi:hypothetical protein